MGYYGTSEKNVPPPGFTRRGLRDLWNAGKCPGHRLPGRGGIIVSVEEWNAWVAAQPTSAAVDPIEADVRARFKVAS